MKHTRFFLTIIVLLVALLLGGQAPAGATSPARPQAAGGPVAYTYDAAGRLIQADYADKRIAYTYDNTGNLLRREVVRGAKVYLPVIMRHDK